MIAVERISFPSEVLLRYRDLTYCSGLARTFAAHSSQQIVIVAPSILIVFASPSTVQPHTGHFSESVTIVPPLGTLACMYALSYLRSHLLPEPIE